MLVHMWLIPALPLLGFLALTLLSGANLSRRSTAFIGVGSVGLSALMALILAANFLLTPPPNHSFIQTYWVWINAAYFSPSIAFHLDSLSLIMILVVTFVGFLIHLYSAEFMIGEGDYGRFFSYMNLFVGMMLILVMADNLLLLYLGWEGVGLCSYLLIGFWYHDPANGRAARKAFIVTRVGDAAMAIGLFLLFDNLDTLQIQELMGRAAQEWPVGSGIAIAAAAFLLGGAVGKSAQLPLQIWLPDAMAGPTPVSALIHAATMVTAGVYLIARTHVLFSLAPIVMTIVAIIGALTLLLAGFSALTQWDIKRVLAYSTMSQIGYMFLALGVGAWSAAIFHFMTHAFFKALLFLGAGVIISRLDHEHNMFKMGGLRKELPLTFWMFLIGACSLAALPLVTAGFYSKDKILYEVWSSGDSLWLWGAGYLGALLTALYTFRMVFLTFFGQAKDLVREHSPLPSPGWRMKLPLLVLGFLSIFGGLLDIPDTLINFSPFTDLLHETLPPTRITPAGISVESVLQIITGVTVLIGIYIAYYLYIQRPALIRNLTQTNPGAAIHRFWFSGWGFDSLDNELIVQPFLWLAQRDKDDIIDRFYDGVVTTFAWFYRLLSGSQTGLIRWYAFGIVIGALITITVVIFL
ncbi:MAG: NADH-quinone oxidoreductase subunit L [Anaerolineales bacterium]|jgi:NADH-quinone oxidoreductase subunit L